MSDRPKRTKPSQVPELRVVETTDAGTVEEFAPSGYVESRLAEYEAQIFAGDDILTGIAPREFLVPGWLVLDGTSLLIAAPGGGKSFFSVMLGMAFATGGTFAGHQLPKKKVLYIAAERSSDIRDRYEAYRNHFGVTDERRFMVWDMREPIDATSADAATYAAKLVRKSGAEIVIIDTYAQVTAEGKENDTNETSRLVRGFLKPVLEATGRGHVMLVHHLGKKEEAGARGSTALVGAVDSQVTLFHEKSSGARWAEVTKLNAGEMPDRENFRIESVRVDSSVTPDGRLVEARSVGVMVATSAPAEAGEEIIRECVETYEGVGGASRVDIQAALGHVTEDEKKSKKNATQARINRLIAQGKLEPHGSGRNVRYQRGPVWRLLEESRVGEFWDDKPPHLDRDGKPFAF